MTHDAAHILDPPLPYDIRPRAERASRNVQLLQFVARGTRPKDEGRQAACHAAFGDRYDEIRRLAGQIRQHALDHLDDYLDEFVDRATAAGTHVHFATDAADARRVCLDIASRHGCRRCVKSKSMVTEEIQLVPAFEAAGIETLETDLGEFIVQLDGDAPSHIVTPIIHKDRRSVGQTFVGKLGVEYTDDPAALTKIARRHMREKYRVADLGVSGANFLVAKTGSIIICTNEGNADLAVSRPPVHIAVTGLEKVVPRFTDAAVLLKLLAHSATAQELTIYTTLIHGPRRVLEQDGPKEVHVVLVDNGRTELLKRSSRELLRCIRCGACLNTCPVYRKLGGGHAYGAVYSGPIGAVITPLLRGLENYPDLPKVSSLCGACHAACPVDIDIPHHLLRLRERLVSEGIVGWAPRMLYRLWARTLARPSRYAVGLAILRHVLRSLGRGDRRRVPDDDRRWVGHLPPPLAGWTDHRDLPSPTRRSFRSWWRDHAKDERHG